MILKSTSQFIDSTLKQISRGKLGSGATLNIEVDPSINLLDLFALGRILAFCEALRRRYAIVPVFQFKKGPRLERLARLGFFEFCKNEQIGYSPEITVPPQRDLGFEPREDGSQPAARLLTFWAPIHPVFAYPITSPCDERAASAQTQHITKAIADTLQRNLAFLRPTTGSLGIEFSRILFGIITELVSNSIRHCRKSKLVVAMTTSYDPNPQTHVHRSGELRTDGKAVYDVLVMDFGDGITRTISDTLGATITPFGDYFDPTFWTDEHSALKKKEEALLKGVFDGSLLVRKGRKSEGLHELSHNVAWFGGLLSFFSGRTEIHLGPDYQVRSRDSKRKHNIHPYYLPGVIASAILPSQELTALRAKKKATDLPDLLLARSSSRDFPIFHFTNIPSALLGAQAHGTLRRRSELDAHVLISEDDALIKASTGTLFTSDVFTPPVWEINLRLAATISIDYLDSLLQELCKLGNTSSGSRSSLLSRLFFTNVPRHVIAELHRRNCSAFLLTSRQLCLLLDESGYPHFLGVPRISTKAFDAEACLRLLYYVGRIDEETLKKHFRVGTSVFEYLNRTLAEGDKALFWADHSGNGAFYFCKDIAAALNASRLRSLNELDSVKIGSEDGRAVCRLRNGNYVDVVYDFNAFWNDTRRLWDASHLLLGVAPYRPVEHLISFVDNGDRLAGVIQRLTATPNLIVVDPQRKDAWNNVDIEGACAIVLDALFPGDDEGYVGEFLRFAPSKKGRIWAVYALCDFRSSTSTESRSSEPEFKHGVVSVPLPAPIRRPRITEPRAGVRVLGSPWRQGKVVPTTPSNSQSTLRRIGSSVQYTAAEFSTEFWHNVSVLRLFDVRRSGREERDVLFYEDTQLLIRHPRMRRLVVDFVCAFVRNTLRAQADVIVYPSHSVGSFLAELIANQLPTPPLQIELAQPQYGGSIEITLSDYARFRTLIDERASALGRESLSAVVVDDSIFTGKSIFTMLGICAELHLEARGIVVLISRLTHEVAQALSRIAVPFESLYRLHMPVLAPEHSPDQRLLVLNSRFAESNSSYCGRLWAQQLAREGSHFLWPEEFEVGKCLAPDIAPTIVESVVAEHLAPHELQILIQELILHPALDIISLATRLAVVHNFLEVLVLEPGFWTVLTALDTSTYKGGTRSLSPLFLQKCLFLLAFTPHVQVAPIHTWYEDLCTKVLKSAADPEALWQCFSDLLTECIMMLGIVGSDHLVPASVPLLRTVLPYVLDRTPSSGGARISSPGESDNDRTEVARRFVGAFAWSCAQLVERLGPKVLHEDHVKLLIEAAATVEGGVEGQLLLIDIFDAVLRRSADLRRVFGISDRREETAFLEELDQEDAPMVRYMREAPGYTCTLSTILRVCRAETVLLYAKSLAEGEFRILVFDTKHNVRTSPALKAEHLTEHPLRAKTKERMAAGLFMCSDNSGDTHLLDQFAIGKRHQWCLGGPIHVPESELEYYLILGYTALPSVSFQATSYYYWLRCGDFLRKTLREIHRRHIVSSAARNAVIQSLTPLHAPHVGGSQNRAIAERRRILRLAVAGMDTGDLLRRAVQMSTEAVYTLPQILDRVADVSSTLHRMVDTAVASYPGLPSGAFDRSGRWPVLVKFRALSQEEQETLCAVHVAVLEFVLYECLCNALSYYKQKVVINTNIYSVTPEQGTPYDRMLHVTVTNDRMENGDERGSEPRQSAPPLSENGTGLRACAAAVEAINGSFAWQWDERQELFLVSVKIPIYVVPPALRERLGGYLG